MHRFIPIDMFICVCTKLYSQPAVIPDAGLRNAIYNQLNLPADALI